MVKKTGWSHKKSRALVAFQLAGFWFVVPATPLMSLTHTHSPDMPAMGLMRSLGHVHTENLGQHIASAVSTSRQPQKGWQSAFPKPGDVYSILLGLNTSLSRFGNVRTCYALRFKSDGHSKARSGQHPFLPCQISMFHLWLCLSVFVYLPTISVFLKAEIVGRERSHLIIWGLRVCGVAWFHNFWSDLPGRAG